MILKFLSFGSSNNYTNLKKNGSRSSNFGPQQQLHLPSNFEWISILNWNPNFVSTQNAMQLNLITSAISDWVKQAFQMKFICSFLICFSNC